MLGPLDDGLSEVVVHKPCRWEETRKIGLSGQVCAVYIRRHWTVVSPRCRHVSSRPVAGRSCLPPATERLHSLCVDADRLTFKCTHRLDGLVDCQTDSHELRDRHTFMFRSI